MVLIFSYFINTTARETKMLHFLSFAQAIVTLRSTHFMSGNLKFVSKKYVHRCFVQMQVSMSFSCINLLRSNGRDEGKEKKGCILIFLVVVLQERINPRGGSPARKDKSQDLSLLQHVASGCFPVQCSKV